MESAAAWSVALDAQAEIVRNGMSQLDGRWHRPSNGLLSASPERVGEIMLDAARYGDTYWWSRELCDVLEATAPAIPDFTLRMGDLVTERGFVWFDRPLAMPVREDIGEGVGLSGLSWSVVNEAHAPRANQPSVYVHSDVPIRAVGAVLTFYVLWDGRPQMYGSTSWYEGESLLALLANSDPDGLNFDWVDAVARYVSAALSFMAQRLVRHSPERATRATRKRIAEVLDADTVQVVRLRRSVSDARAERGAEPVEWSCRWFVRGHWRQQACGQGLAERRPVFVLPYVKGPDDKPLRAAAERVFAVVQ